MSTSVLPVVIKKIVELLKEDELKNLFDGLNLNLPSKKKDILTYNNITFNDLKKELKRIKRDDVIKEISDLVYNDEDLDDDDDYEENSNISGGREAKLQKKNKLNLKSPTKNNSHLKSNVCGYMLVPGIIVAVFAIGVYVAVEQGLFSPMHSYQTVIEFENEMNNVRIQFPNQYEFSINMLTNVGKRHLQKVEKKDQADLRPMSFLIAGYKGSSETLNCFLSKLGHAYTHKEYTTINSEEYFGKDSKQEFDNKLIASLKDTQKFVIVKNVDKLQFETAQLFMTYSDEYSAVASYPQSTIILTTSLPFPYDYSSSRHDDEGKVGTYFRNNVWKGEDTNNVAALWTRVGDGLILLRPEKTIHCLQS